LSIIPDRPSPAPHNLGEWELDGVGQLIVVMSGVYSFKNRESGIVKTIFRGSAASLTLRPYRVGGLFRFCKENKNEKGIISTANRPYSAKEARIRKDLSLMNRFEVRTYTFRALGDSTKRRWLDVMPRVFGDLLKRWYVSTPHRQVDNTPVDSPSHDLMA
jgi:hypothetical protein